MSPEQVRGDTLTPASDVYSVAIMTYELLTGALPFPETSTATGLLAHHLVTEPTPLTTTKPELPGTIGAVLDRALSKDLTVRQATALEFATDLTRVCAILRRRLVATTTVLAALAGGAGRVGANRRPVGANRHDSGPSRSSP